MMLEDNIEERNACMCNKDTIREEMMSRIKELNFAIIELALYLDTHPDDEKAYACIENIVKNSKI